MRTPVPRPVLVYDGRCGFCRRWIARWRARTGRRVVYLPFQRPGVLPVLGLSPADARRAVQLIEPGGRTSHGAAAVFRALSRAPEMRAAARIALLPPVRWVAEWVYRRVARHRSLAGRVDRLLFGTSVTPPRRQLVRWVFLRALGGVYLLAFTSLGAQVLGLYGKRGILPVADLLERVRENVGPERYQLLPTLLWLDASDETLTRLCRAGQVVSAALLLDLAPRPSALTLWALYLSFVSVGQEFLSYQWDALLLEAGLLAVLAAPSGLAPGLRAPPPSWIAVAMLRWLAFRLYFESGLAKVQSGDETWRGLTACCHYYETEPLPNRAGWHAHQLPRPVQRFSTAAVLALECVTPFLSLGPRRVRRLAFWLLSGLQGLFALTGSYGFFNLLSAALGVWLLDDEPLERLLPPSRRSPGKPRSSRRRRLRTAADSLLAVPLLALSAGELARRFRGGRRALARSGPVVRGLARLDRLAQPLHAVNPYGLFAVMTIQRPEIAIEGSDDGMTWREYGFRYKPGALARAPRQAAPHQPRLDWQMWLAALGPPPTWFIAFLVRLLQGSPDVLALLEENPFPEKPPRYLRAILYDYRMTDPETRRRTGAWWRRERLGPYFPTISIAPERFWAEGGFHDHEPARA